MVVIVHFAGVKVGCADRALREAFGRRGRRLERDWRDAHRWPAAPATPRSKSSHHGELNVGVAYAALGRKDLALARLERAVRNGWPCYPRYAGGPLLARTLAGDPGYESLMKWRKAEWDAYRRDFPLPT